MARLQVLFDDNPYEIPDRALPGLQKLAHAYNAQTSQDLTLGQFIVHHLREMAIAEDLNARLPDVQREAQEEVERRIAAARDQLLAGLD